MIAKVCICTFQLNGYCCFLLYLHHIYIALYKGINLIVVACINSSVSSLALWRNLLQSFEMSFWLIRDFVIYFVMYCHCGTRCPIKGGSLSLFRCWVIRLPGGGTFI